MPLKFHQPLAELLGLTPQHDPQMEDRLTRLDGACQ